MASRRTKTFWIVVAVVALVGVVASQAGGGDRGAQVRIEEVRGRDLVASVTASGRIEPARSVDIASDITGRIVALPVVEGQHVTRGQLLLRIDPTQYQAAVQRAEAQLATARAQELQAVANRNLAERELRRQRQLRETDPDLVRVSDFETAENNYEVAAAVAEAQRHQVAQAEAGLREAEEQLSKTVLRAPMNGQITRLAVEEGEVALASTFSRETGLLMTVSDLSVIQVNVRVDETDVVRLQLGDSSEITIDAFPDTTFVGRVTNVSQSAIQEGSSTSNTADRAVDYDVEVTLDNPPPDIRPDLSATAKIVTDTRKEALSIPIIALTVREHRPLSTETLPQPDTTATETEGVFVVMNGIAYFRPVTVGIAGEEHFEVLAGLQLGDSIVAGPYQIIRDLADSSGVRPLPTSNEDARGR